MCQKSKGHLYSVKTNARSIIHVSRVTHKKITIYNFLFFEKSAIIIITGHFNNKKE